jgi:integrase
MAEEFKPSQSSTLRELAEFYAEKNIAKNSTDAKRIKQQRSAFVSNALRYFKDIADVPGSAISVYIPDENGVTPLSKVFGPTTELGDAVNVKGPMIALRTMGHDFKRFLDDSVDAKKFLPDKAADTEVNEKLFGRLEPPKKLTPLAINPNKTVLTELFVGLANKTKSDDFNTRSASRAALFGMLTGLRPEAIANLKMHEYNPTKGALFIRATEGGAKGRMVNIPLNPLADSLLQDMIKEGIGGTESGGVINIFGKMTKGSNAPNKRITTGDITNVLRDIQTSQPIMYDQDKNAFFNSLTPDGYKGKTGSPLLRNIHATLMLNMGVPTGRIGYLQGRSTLQADLGPIGELGTYTQAYPFAVSEFDRNFSNQIISYFDTNIKEAGFNLTDFANMDKGARILETDPRYSKYFEEPNATLGNQFVKTAINSASDFTDDLKDMIAKLGGSITDKGSKVLVGAIGVEAARQLVTDPSAFAKEMIAEKGVELGLKAAGLGAKAVAAGPTAIIESLRPSQIAKDPIFEADIERQYNFREDDLVTDEEPNFLNQQPIQENTNAGQ